MCGKKDLFVLVFWSGLISSQLMALTPEQVLVVYNSQSAGATTVLNAYLAAHPSLPAANVFNLNSATIANQADITYAAFKQHIRDPIRAYLNTAGNPTAEQIMSICLIRGLPHRILDHDNPSIGDSPNGLVNEVNAGDATCASVDSELVLLWQNLDSVPGTEIGGNMESYADNFIDNPYHTSTAAIQTFSRTKIKNAKSFNKYSLAWKQATSPSTRLTPGDMYLVSRIDGTTLEAAVASIGRAVGLRVNRKYAWIILDEDARADHLDDEDYGDLVGSMPDYEFTRDLLSAAGFNVRYDNTAEFILPTTFSWPIVAYASYGENHVTNPPGAGTYIEGFRFAPGAIFNTYESYNGRALNGLGTLLSQEQVGDFIAAGGTFGIGHVWEPLAFSVADNYYLFSAMLLGNMTWAEAAWTSIPVLSWMHVVLGDPLARATVIDQIADFDADADVDGDDLDHLRACQTGPAVGPPTPTCTGADLNADDSVDQLDFAILQRCLSTTTETLRPDCAE